MISMDHVDTDVNTLAKQSVSTVRIVHTHHMTQSGPFTGIYIHTHLATGCFMCLDMSLGAARGGVGRLGAAGLQVPGQQSRWGHL